MTIDLTKKPFYLSMEDIRWVTETIEAMTIEEKIGQLFVDMISTSDEKTLTTLLRKYPIGGTRYTPREAKEVYDQNQILQSHSKIPLLIAANTEAGGNGACTDGTEIGKEVKIGATNDSKYAYEMGRISGIEASAIGCNWSFAPIVDIMYNWRNPIISSRSFANDPDLVLEMSLAYMRGIQESGIAPAAKHFPGDGVDERDQHLSYSINHLSCEEWDATYGKVYKGLIEAGLPSIMAGHIHQPAYSRYFNQELIGKHTLPATLSKELLTDLLRKKLGFNGLIVTDASHMLGMTSSMKRADILPTAIAAGCDLFLFFNDPEEDFQYMMNGYRSGVITEERLQEALMRILGLKASLGLHKKTQFLEPKKHALAKIGLPESKLMFEEIANEAITLVKEENDVLPMQPKKYPRVLLVGVKGTENDFGEVVAGNKGNPIEYLKEVLVKEGFEVEIYKSIAESFKSLPKEEFVKSISKIYSQKSAISEITNHYDVVINLVNVNPSTVQRPIWPMSKGTPDIPFYVHEIPTIIVSIQSPYHLADMPQAKTYINAFDGNRKNIEVLVEKLMGKTPFKGKSNIDVYCGNLLDY
ncbi:MAG TPA: beta-hexosaminidase [Enterococcus sp.]|uniref:glycoside hydrolase family 3 protein n=1 Tax=Enterococcus sp. TaxID=35783 RepID=UPI000EC38414|nr:glycoside hydrolase family 3 N-terminal domain-containing protein [Enterococcus sp.]HCE11871.1 beta-hexosaminidase [Enterococcus sp.]